MMKRIPLQRKTPLKRGSKGLKRTGFLPRTGRLARVSTMKHKPPKYPSSKLLRDRTQWAKQFTFCWICKSTENLNTHEMATKALAPGKWAHRCNYFRACNSCNCHVLTDRTAWPVARQLWVKARFDREHFDLPTWRSILGRAETTAITDDLLIYLVDGWHVLYGPRRCELLEHEGD